MFSQHSKVAQKTSKGAKSGINHEICAYSYESKTCQSLKQFPVMLEIKWQEF